jgi:hypothetical protein
MTTYTCTDGNADIEIEAESATDAAREYVEGGEWGDGPAWIDVHVTPLNDDGDEMEDASETITITIEATEPDCNDGEDHDWRSPHCVVGGIKENPGVWGNGGGVIITEVCALCGAYRITNTWAQRPDTGEQGLESVTYRDADEDSLTWVKTNENQ